jgi:SAM-dependent methyltransferase
MSICADLYLDLYGRLCGRPPHLHPWHFQWLAIRYLCWDLREALPTLYGRVLDVGCGSKPYAAWLDAGKVVQHLGIDIYPGPNVDVVITLSVPWPLETASFDAILCTQVLEHVENLEHVLSEMHRVLKPGGTLLASIPFAYNEHDLHHDYRRLSLNGARCLLEKDYEIQALKAQGGIGSTLAIFWLNWINQSMTAHKVTRFARALLLPVWLLISLVTNTVGVLLDWIDNTKAFYGNTFVIARKKSSDH